MNCVHWFILGNELILGEEIDRMSVALIVGGGLVIVLLVWLVLRTLSDTSVETTKSVLSSDNYTKVVLTIIAFATSIIALQGFLN